jgi:hypothetical protein
MATRARTYNDWRSTWAEARARCDEIDALLSPPMRLKPRDPDEAEFLRSIGTPDSLIGPVPVREQLEQVRACLVERLGDDQEAEQWLWYRPNGAADGRPPVVLLIEDRFPDLLELASRAEPASPTTTN